MASFMTAGAGPGTGPGAGPAVAALYGDAIRTARDANWLLGGLSRISSSETFTSASDHIKELIKKNIKMRTLTLTTQRKILSMRI